MPDRGLLIPLPLKFRSGSGAVTGQVTRPFMKQTLLFLGLAVVLIQSGCALGPTIDEQSKQETQQDQVVKRSDAFARGLEQ